jgi:polyphosphate kinase
LRPGIRGVSDRIRVCSIVGRILEHSRIYYFLNNGSEEIYTGSADWMPRNLYERVEVLAPIRDPLLRDRVRHEILQVYLADTAKARFLQRDGSYVHARDRLRKRKGKPQPGFSAQEFLIGLAEGRNSSEVVPVPVAKKPRLATHKER